jgi:hypothetical protein
MIDRALFWHSIGQSANVAIGTLDERVPALASETTPATAYSIAGENVRDPVTRPVPEVVPNRSSTRK